ncbi:Hypothetical_protein [Hexamita inflata]|uniref:Hypothetical_protein n=1 Tax=Hexamita inflata TaxID=28002 RepID=A0AA86RLF9_9EUKA|nr:Hypothetical protein HINF_LOCUS63428 [Hexamita inflata]
MLILFLSLTYQNQIDHCFGCLFKPNLTTNGMIIKLTRLCDPSEARVKVLYRGKIIYESLFDPDLKYMVTNVMQLNDITVVAEQNGRYYKFQRGPISKNINNAILIVSIVVSLCIALVITFILLMQSRANKLKQVPKKQDTPSNSSEYCTNILQLN